MSVGVSASSVATSRVAINHQFLSTLPEAWQGGFFRFDPHHGHLLGVFVEGSNSTQAIAEFHEEPIELVWDAKSLQALGLAWRFGATEQWCGTIYSIKTDQDPLPPVECRDLRLMPSTVFLLRLTLITRTGEKLAERRVKLSEAFGWSLHTQISAQNDAYTNPVWMARVVDQIARNFPTPSRFASSPSVQAENRRCVAENLD